MRSSRINSREIRNTCHFQQIRINATKFGKTGIHFKSDVFAVFALVDAKAPYSLLWLHIYEFHVIYILNSTTSTIPNFFSRTATKKRGHCAHFIAKGDKRGQLPMIMSFQGLHSLEKYLNFFVSPRKVIELFL